LKSLAQKKLPSQAPRGDTGEKSIPHGGLRAKTADFIMIPGEKYEELYFKKAFAADPGASRDYIFVIRDDADRRQ
jgi:hypothetical protein